VVLLDLLDEVVLGVLPHLVVLVDQQARVPQPALHLLQLRLPHRIPLRASFLYLEVFAFTLFFLGGVLVELVEGVEVFALLALARLLRGTPQVLLVLTHAPAQHPHLLLPQRHTRMVLEGLELGRAEHHLLELRGVIRVLRPEQPHKVARQVLILGGVGLALEGHHHGEEVGCSHGLFVLGLALLDFGGVGLVLRQQLGLIRHKKLHGLAGGLVGLHPDPDDLRRLHRLVLLDHPRPAHLAPRLQMRNLLAHRVLLMTGAGEQVGDVAVLAGEVGGAGSDLAALIGQRLLHHHLLPTHIRIVWRWGIKVLDVFLFLGPVAGGPLVLVHQEALVAAAGLVPVDCRCRRVLLLHPILLLVEGIEPFAEVGVSFPWEPDLGEHLVQRGGLPIAAHIALLLPLLPLLQIGWAFGDHGELGRAAFLDLHVPLLGVVVAVDLVVRAVRSVRLCLDPIRVLHQIDLPGGFHGDGPGLLFGELAVLELQVSGGRQQPSLPFIPQRAMIPYLGVGDEVVAVVEPAVEGEVLVEVLSLLLLPLEDHSGVRAHERLLLLPQHRFIDVDDLLLFILFDFLDLVPDDEVLDAAGETLAVGVDLGGVGEALLVVHLAGRQLPHPLIIFLQTGLERLEVHPLATLLVSLATAGEPPLDQLLGFRVDQRLVGALLPLLMQLLGLHPVQPVHRLRVPPRQVAVGGSCRTRLLVEVLLLQGCCPRTCQWVPRGLALAHLEQLSDGASHLQLSLGIEKMGLVLLLECLEMVHFEGGLLELLLLVDLLDEVVELGVRLDQPLGLILLSLIGDGDVASDGAFLWEVAFWGGVEDEFLLGGCLGYLSEGLLRLQIRLKILPQSLLHGRTQLVGRTIINACRS